MKITQTPTKRAKISGTRGRTVVYIIDEFQPDYADSWWIWAGRVSTYLLSMIGIIISLMVLSFIL